MRLNRHIPHNSVLQLSSGKVEKLANFYSNNFNYKVVNSEFSDFIRHSPLISGANFTYDGENLATIFYRDFYQLFYTKKQYEKLFSLIQSGQKIIIRTGDPYLRRLLISYRKNGYKNVKVYNNEHFH